jgi:hypothetical protein
MQRQITSALKQLAFKRAYGVIALLLFFAFAWRVSVVCINGGTGLTKFQQLITEDSQEQNNNQEDSKFDIKQFTEFISPSYMEIPCLTVIEYVVGHPAYLSLYIKVPLRTVIAPPPDMLSA